MTDWVAVAYGALRIRECHESLSGANLMLVPVTPPAEPIGLTGAPARLWERLVARPFSEEEMNREERMLVHEFAEFGIASNDLTHPARVHALNRPWLSSPLHELVYALVASIARDHGIPLIFIKGPVLHRQGLREREHSGDVDVWVSPSRSEDLATLLEPWGWLRAPDVWSGLPVNHSVTLRPGNWGCELDIHHHFPGVAAAEELAFTVLERQTTLQEFASVMISVPKRSAHAVVEALHLTRPEIGGHENVARQVHAANILEAGGQPSLDLALRLGADASLETPLLQAFPGTFHGSSDAAPLNWRWRAEKNPIRAYLLAMRSVPAKGRARVLFRLVWPKADVVFASNSRAGVEETNLTKARMKRLIRAFQR